MDIREIWYMALLGIYPWLTHGLSWPCSFPIYSNVYVTLCPGGQRFTSQIFIVYLRAVSEKVNLMPALGHDVGFVNKRRKSDKYIYGEGAHGKLKSHIAHTLEYNVLYRIVRRLKERRALELEQIKG